MADVAAPSLRVVVVDDESAITELVGTVLRYEGFDVHIGATGREALRLVEQFAPHLLILDVQMPDLDGFEVQSRLVGSGYKIPVIFLTAKDGTSDRVRGFALGADDYVPKPFSIEELVARVRAVLRRSGQLEVAAGATYRFADLELDDERHEVRRGTALIDLTPTEFNLLRFFLQNPGRVLSKDRILSGVWHYDFDGDASVVETYVSYLRRKLEPHGPPVVHTVRGVGYVLRASPNDAI